MARAFRLSLAVLEGPRPITTVNILIDAGTPSRILYLVLDIKKAAVPKVGLVENRLGKLGLVPQESTVAISFEG